MKLPRPRLTDLFALALGLSMTAFATPVFAQTHVTKAQAAVCHIGWDQTVGTNAPDVLATVQAYVFNVSVDGGTAGPIQATCSGSAAPYSCTASLPQAAQTVGTHTISVTVTDPIGQVSPAATLALTVDNDPIGPPPAPRNLRLIIGAIIAAIMAWVASHHG